MDNLTHSLTGALAAKLIETTLPALAREPQTHRQKFWLLVGCANLPDIDAALGWFGDPIFSMSHHRGLTHSLLFAPVFALLPALLFAKWGKRQPFKTLWLYALTGILLHIFFDLITPFGTQLFAPVSSARYALDWMFIIDLFFTGVLGVTLFFGKLFKSQPRRFLFGGGIFLLLYLLGEMLNHHLAYNRFAAALGREKIVATKISALPQPLSIFRWMGLAQTGDGVVQTFFVLFDDNKNMKLTTYENAQDAFVAQAWQAPETQWYFTFARHPWVRSEPQGDQHVVEWRDLQFAFDKVLLNALGAPEWQPPFVLRYTFPANGESPNVMFNGKKIN